ncbi:MAG: hypothetical protein V8S36_06305 [Lachnospiraceae bacterium]
MKSHLAEDLILQRTEARTYGASDSAGGARSATVAEGRKSGSAEPESAVASGTIARYVAATGMDNSDVAVFTA